MGIAMEGVKKNRPGNVRVLRLTPALALKRAARKFVDRSESRCPKCGSAFIGREPAFVRCRYCGKLARIAGASLVDQELFELRSGLRSVS
jgi:tRNA(Ile2) C34 agmatinyltransferase TiaS